MDENKYKFQKLTPVNDADISVYEEAIDFAFNNSDIKNIAISGAYSAGKSSVLESYKAKKPDKRFIHISLAHFRTPEYENSESETIIKESVLEGKILNQLIHQIQSNKIPQTNFRVKKGIDPKRLIFLTLFASLYLGSIAFLLLMSPIIDYITMLPEGWLKLVLSVFVNPYIQVIIAAITATCSVITIFSLIKAQKNKNLFRKISLQGNEIEIFEDQEDSYFDKYLNEVLYLFENVEADVIVFEDMDRFNASRIFERLREVNTLVNIHRTKENSDNKVTLKFFYLLRDDIFTTKDRTKFFDYIIPIVPVVDNSNSYEQFLKHLKTSNFIERFDQSFLQSLSLYIDDMRILKNIYNEFVVYIHRLNTTDLDWNKMMAVITYKNLFPRDFSDLQLSKGFLFTLFSQKPQLIETTLSDTKEKREVLRYRINCIKDEILISHQELDDAYLGKESRLPKSYGHLTNDGQKQKKANDLELKKRKQVVQDKLERILPELESQLAEIEQEIALIQTKSLQELITRYNENKFFSTTLTTEIDAKNDFKVIMESDYFDLLKFLIRNGHIDEKTYNDYLTYFYEDSISANDKTFLRRITDKRGAEYTYILKDPKKVIESPIIRAVEFDQVETLNFDLFHCLLRDDSDPIYAVYEKRLIEQIKRAKKFDFISNFYESGKSTSQFIIKINEIWPQFFLIALQEKAIPFNQIRQYSMDTLYYSSNDEIITVNEDNILSQYISNTPDYLNIENPVADRLIEGFSLIDVKFVTLDYELSNRKLFDAVYRNFLYILSFDNISLMIKQEYGFERDWDICHKNYTLIQSFPV